MEVFFTLIYFMSRRSKLTATFFRFVVTFRQSRAITKLRFASPRCRETENADLPVRIHLPRNFGPTGCNKSRQQRQLYTTVVRHLTTQRGTTVVCLSRFCGFENCTCRFPRTTIIVLRLPAQRAKVVFCERVAYVNRGYLCLHFGFK